jgi:hypothetical protein
MTSVRGWDVFITCKVANLLRVYRKVVRIVGAFVLFLSAVRGGRQTSHALRMRHVVPLICINVC